MVSSSLLRGALVASIGAVLVSCGGRASMPGPTAGAPSNGGASAASSHFTLSYKLVLVDPFGGPNTFGDLAHGGAANIANNGTVSGIADTSSPNPAFPNFNPLMQVPGVPGVPDPFVFHAFSWRNGILTDLGALPGANSSAASWITSNGMLCGQSLNGVVDPITGFMEEHAVLWRGGRIIDLGTLGGNESGAGACNSQGQVTGFAANKVPDPFSLLGLGTQTRAFVWQDGTMRDLGTLGGPDAFSPLMNEPGQVAGFSYTSSVPGPLGGPPVDPFLWDRGRMIDLGTLGGTFGAPNALNDRGQVVGGSDLAGDLVSHPFLWDQGRMKDLGTLGGSFGAANAIAESGSIVGGTSLAGDQAFHAFVWSHGALTDLGTVNGRDSSNALAINAKDQIVGLVFSLATDSGARATLWIGGEVIDLNAFVPPDAKITLLEAHAINDDGDIFGTGALANGERRAYVLIPSAVSDSSARSAQTQTSETHIAAAPKQRTHNTLFWRQLLYPALHTNRLRRN